MAMTSRRSKITDEELLNYIRVVEDPFVTAAELADEFEMTRQGINGRLNQLKSSGVLKSKQCGSGQGWWLPDT